MTHQKAKRDRKDAKRDSGKRDSLARARPPYGGDVTVSRVTASHRDVTGSRDSALTRTITAGTVDEMQAPAGGPASHGARTEAHRAALAADPRFAAWASMAPTSGTRRGLMDADQIAPDVALILAERQELIRCCAARVVADHEAGRGNDPHRLQWAQSVIASTPPLAGPLSDGVVRQQATETT